jgi:hypothetical protein
LVKGGFVEENELWSHPVEGLRNSDIGTCDDKTKESESDLVWGKEGLKWRAGNCPPREIECSKVGTSGNSAGGRGFVTRLVGATKVQTNNIDCA